MQEENSVAHPKALCFRGIINGLSASWTGQLKEKHKCQPHSLCVRERKNWLLAASVAGIAFFLSIFI